MKKFIKKEDSKEEEYSKKKLPRIPLIYLIFPPLGFFMLFKYFLENLNDKEEE